MDNKEIQKKKLIINRKRNTYFFVGFIVGILPFILLLIVLSMNKGLIISNQLFKNTLLVIGIITSITNALILRNKITKHLEELLNISYK